MRASFYYAALQVECLFLHACRAVRRGVQVVPKNQGAPKLFFKMFFSFLRGLGAPFTPGANPGRLRILPVGVKSTLSELSRLLVGVAFCRVELLFLSPARAPASPRAFKLRRSSFFQQNVFINSAFFNVASASKMLPGLSSNLNTIWVWSTGKFKATFWTVRVNRSMSNRVKHNGEIHGQHLGQLTKWGLHWY